MNSQSGVTCSIYTLIFLVNEDQPLIGDDAEYCPCFIGRAVIHDNHLSAEGLLAQEVMHQLADSVLCIKDGDDDTDINIIFHRVKED
ncbi:hypothetical protein M942_24805 [Enterobacter ludwigii]|nr:hypothetical protein M942_24805 [Enterobacter ludwigii]